MLWAFFMRPVLPFALQCLLLAPLILGAHLPEMGALYLFLSPWLLLGLGILNLPLVIQAFRLFRMDLRVRRNHALEHATIHFLMAGGASGLAGRAAEDGFRVSGGVSPPAIRAAFDQVRALIQTRQRLPYVSRHCGSNRITALGMGMVLLFAVALASIVARPALPIRALALVAVVVVFIAMRHMVGNHVQVRLFMATDFADAWVRTIRKTQATELEQPPVYFVETVVVEDTP